MMKCLFLLTFLILRGTSIENDPTLAANLFEGDIAGLSDRYIAILHGKSSQNRKFYRNGVRLKRNLWPNNTIPYNIKISDFSGAFLKNITIAMKEFQKKTCIR